MFESGMIDNRVGVLDSLVLSGVPGSPALSHHIILIISHLEQYSALALCRGERRTI